MNKNDAPFIATVLGMLGGYLGWTISKGFWLTLVITFIGMSAGILLGFAIDAKEKRKRIKRRHTEEEKARDMQKEYIGNITDKHLEVLSRKRNQFRRTNEYGVLEDEKWRKEIVVFFNSVIKSVPGEMLCLSADEIARCIDNRVANYQEINENKHYLVFNDDMDGYEYEYFCADILSKNGWDAKVTQGSGDQGVDVVAKKNSKTIAIQCKKYSGQVGNKAVQEVHAGKGYINADMAVVVSNASFTPSAVELADALGVHLFHHNDLDRLDNLTIA